MRRGRLWGMRAYLCGPMDNAPDGGVGWRRKACEWLEARGCTPFDPTDKPIDLGGETDDDRARRRQMIEDGRLEELAAEIKQLRCVDLRMVDITDFTIVHLDMTARPCGTFEELFLANREMKPVLVMSPAGDLDTPLWLYGTVPHQHIFHNWDALYSYLDEVDRGEGSGLMKRWYFFNQSRLHRVTVQQTVKEVLVKLLSEKTRLMILDETYVDLGDLCEAFGLDKAEVDRAIH